MQVRPHPPISSPGNDYSGSRPHIPGCTVGGARKMSGHSVQTNCDVVATGNAGWSVLDASSQSYGSNFNKNGGGFFAMERSNAGVKVWFWPRHAKGIPADVANGAKSVNTDKWGTPAAHFPSTSCNMAQHFGPHNIVINLSLCACLSLSL